MKLLDATIILLLFVCVRSADIAIGAGIGRDFVRAIIYGIVALLALIFLVLRLV